MFLKKIHTKHGKLTFLIYDSRKLKFYGLLNPLLDNEHVKILRILKDLLKNILDKKFDINKWVHYTFTIEGMFKCIGL